MLDLEPIKAREKAATVGLWFVPDPHGQRVIISGRDGAVARTYTAGDAHFIAAARSDIPALIAEVERQQRALMEIRGRLYEGGDIGNDGLDAITLPFSPQAGVERLRGEIDGAGE